MTTSRKPYEPAKVPSKGKLPGTETFSRLARRRWDFTNLGTWVVRDVRNKPGVMSQHSAGRALDLQYSDRAAQPWSSTWIQCPRMPMVSVVWVLQLALEHSQVRP